tara:strand:+ start:1804 stop:3606 length:1803 start_codon:yes stop_codon:yes gene_type:complete
MNLQVSALLTIFAAQSAFAQFGDEPPKFNPSDPAAPQQDRLTAEIVADVTSAAPGKPFLAAVKLTHAPLHHTYGKVLPPDVIGRPTSVTWTVPEGWKLEEVPWPATYKVLSTEGKMSEGYDGITYLPVRVTPAPSASDSGEITAQVSALVCDPHSCMPFSATPSLSISLADTAIANQVIPSLDGKAKLSGTNKSDDGEGKEVDPETQRSFLTYLFFAFIGGLILNVMPCVFPVLGIKIMGIVGQAGDDRKKVIAHGFAYTAGVLLSFWVLGLVVILLGKGWGFQLQSPTFVFALCAFFLVFALNMAGLFEIGISVVGLGSGLQAKQGIAGSFFSGLLATLVATPCSAPFLGAALGVTLSLPPALAMLVFTSVGIGLAFPFLLLSAFPNLVSSLPKPGAWMDSLKQGMSFLLFGTAAFLAWTLTGLVESLDMLVLLLSLVVVAMGCWIYGRWNSPLASAKTRTIVAVIALLTIAGGISMGWPSQKMRLDWGTWSETTVEELRRSKKPVYIDFTAKWCATCQINKRVYKNERLQALFKEKGVELLIADWTNEGPAIQKAINDLGKAAIPVNVLYIPGEDEPVILPELLTVKNVTEALNRISG